MMNSQTENSESSSPLKSQSVNEFSMLSTLNKFSLCSLSIEAQTKVMEAALAYRKNHLVFDIYQDVL